MAGEPRDIIAAAFCEHRYEYDDQRGRATCDCGWFKLVGTRWDHENHLAEAVLAALTDAGITLCHEREATPFAHAAYVPVEDTP